MRRGLKLAHYLGLVLFIGSIITFTLISTLIEGASLESVVFGRTVISTGTTHLTLPGLWMLIISGIGMGYLREGRQHSLLRWKLLFSALIVLNSYLMVVPAVSAATELAGQSLTAGHLLAAYHPAYLQESLFGAINVVLALALSVIGTWKLAQK